MIIILFIYDIVENISIMLLIFCYNLLDHLELCICIELNDIYGLVMHRVCLVYLPCILLFVTGDMISCLLLLPNSLVLMLSRISKIYHYYNYYYTYTYT